MSKSPEKSPLKGSYPQSGKTIEGYKEESSYQGHNQKQNQQQPQQPLLAGIFPEQHHPKDISQQTDKEPQLSATWVSLEQDDYDSTSQQQPLSAPQHPQSPKNDNPLPSSQSSYPENVSYEEFIAKEEQDDFSSRDPTTGFPNSWAKVSPPPAARAASPPVEQTSPAKVLPPSVQKASPPNVPRTVLQPPPPPSSSCSCCAIL